MASSVYSDSFALEALAVQLPNEATFQELAKQLSKEATVQEWRVVTALTVDRDNLVAELSRLRSAWDLITMRNLLLEISSANEKLQQLNNSIVERIQKERSKRLVNFTDF